MLTSRQILELFNNYLDNLPYDRQPQSLYAPVRYVLSMGGKRIRPCLLLMAYDMYRDNPQDVLPQACGLEVYHNYTLLHDDLMDNANMRRGHATVHVKWNPNTAILSGDSMLVLAYKLMMRCEPAKMSAILGLFTETALEIGEGQQYDMDFENRTDVAEGEYIEMIRLKTSVLLACALKMGAVLAGAPGDDADSLYKFGEQVGLAFQLQDDYLDVYGDPKVFGKAIGGDILCNKKTYMLINAYNRADRELRMELLGWINAEHCAPEEKIAAVTSIYDRIGIGRIAKEKIKSCFDESRKYLDAVRLPNNRKQVLMEYVDAIMERSF